VLVKVNYTASQSMTLTGLLPMTVAVYSGALVSIYYFRLVLWITCLQCFDAVGWAAEEHPACKKN